MEKEEIICLLKYLNWGEIEDLPTVIDKLFVLYSIKRGAVNKQLQIISLNHANQMHWIVFRLGAFNSDD